MLALASDKASNSQALAFSAIGVYGMVCHYGMVEVCEGAPVAVSGWVLTDRHDLGPCAANSLASGNHIR